MYSNMPQLSYSVVLIRAEVFQAAFVGVSCYPNVSGAKRVWIQNRVCSEWPHAVLGSSLSRLSSFMRLNLDSFLHVVCLVFHSPTLNYPVDKET